jgi:hypothetical protein
VLWDVSIQTPRESLIEPRTGAERAVPNELRSYTKRARYTEKYRVVLHLRQTIVGQERSRMGVDVRPGVLCLSSLIFVSHEQDNT